jgi:hypothetical protein
MLHYADGFSIQSRISLPVSSTATVATYTQSKNCLYALDPSSIGASSSLVLADATWRQYVSLALVGGVLLDIVLGSPVANSVLKPLKGNEGEMDNEDDSSKKAAAVTRSKERVDSEQFAKDALARAENTLELRRFLDERKTDWDRMDEMKKSLDETMQEFDEDYQARGDALSKELEKRRKD